MKLTRSISFLLIAILVVLAGSSCNSSNEDEVAYISVSSSQASYSKNDLLETADIVLRGTVVAKGNTQQTNPNFEKTAENGTPLKNYFVTDYTINIHEIYKGEHTKESIDIKVGNNRGAASLPGISADKNITVIDNTNIPQLELEIGKEYILILYKEFGTYYVFTTQGCFEPTIDGDFINNNNITISPNTLKEEITNTLQPK